MEDRTLNFALDIPALYYQYNDCVKRVIGICWKTEPKREILDLRLPEVRAKISAMGFVAVQREKPLP